MVARALDLVTPHWVHKSARASLAARARHGTISRRATNILTPQIPSNFFFFHQQRQATKCWRQGRARFFKQSLQMQVAAHLLLQSSTPT